MYNPQFKNALFLTQMLSVSLLAGLCVYAVFSDLRPKWFWKLFIPVVSPALVLIAILFLDRALLHADYGDVNFVAPGIVFLSMFFNGLALVIATLARRFRIPFYLTLVFVVGAATWFTVAQLWWGHKKIIASRPTLLKLPNANNRPRH